MRASESRSAKRRTALLVRKSIVARQKIKKGETFSNFNLTCKRPGYGMPSSKIKMLLNKKSNKNYNTNQMIKINL